MNTRKHLCWLLALALALLLSLPMTGLAGTEKIVNEDGSYVSVYTNDKGIVVSKFCYDKDGRVQTIEYFDNQTGIIWIKFYYKEIAADNATVSRLERTDNYENGKLINYEIPVRDEKGLITSSSFYDAADKLIKTAKYTFTPEMEMAEYFDADGKPAGKSILLLDEDGEAGEEAYNAAGVLIMKQDHRNGIVQEFYDSGAPKYESINARNDDGSSVQTSKNYNEAGTLTQQQITSFDKNRVPTSEKLTEYYRDGSIRYTFEKADGTTKTSSYNKAGVLTMQSVEDSRGLLEYAPDKSGALQLTTIRTTTQKDGVTTTIISKPNEKGEFVPTEVETITFADGLTVTTNAMIDENGKPVPTSLSKSYKNDEGVWIGEEYSVDGDGKETLFHIFKYYMNEDKVDISENYSVSDEGKLVLDSLVKTYQNPDGTSKEETYKTNAKGELVLVDTMVFDEDGSEIKPEKTEMIIFPAPAWYPSNTASTAGFSFRKLRPELTDKWYNFTPVDLSKDGVQEIPLVAGNLFIVGTVEVTVNGDEVKVSYAMPGTKYDTARSQSEFFTFFASLDAVTTVNPEEIGEGFKFGEPISIEKDLKGDTKVLLFVRNVLTFCDHYTGDKKLARYWPNSKNYNNYYQYLESIMD